VLERKITTMINHEIVKLRSMVENNSGSLEYTQGPIKATISSNNMFKGANGPSYFNGETCKFTNSFIILFNYHLSSTTWHAPN